MKIQVKTAILKEVVNKVIKASTNNKMVPLTGLLSLSATNGVFKAVASDAVNYFEINFQFHVLCTSSINLDLCIVAFSLHNCIAKNNLVCNLNWLLRGKKKKTISLTFCHFCRQTK